MTAQPKQLPFDLGHRRAFGRDDFWVSPSNQEAVGWIDKWPEWPAPALVIYGPSASGKTHLLNVWREETAAAPLSRETLSLPQGITSVMIDDALSLIGQKESEEKLFHLYNALQAERGHMLLSASVPVRDWPFVLPDLKSRLMAAPAVEIGLPDDQLCAVVLMKLFADRQIYVTQDVVEFILARIERSFSAMRDGVEKIDRAAMAEKRPVTVPLVRSALTSGDNVG